MRHDIAKPLLEEKAMEADAAKRYNKKKTIIEVIQAIN